MRALRAIFGDRLVLCGVVSLMMWAAFFFIPYPHEPAGEVPFFARFLVKSAFHKMYGVPLLVFALFIPYFIAFGTLRRRRFPRDRKVMWLFTAAFSVLLVVRLLPVGTADLYYYAFQGRMLPTYGDNPYRAKPSAYTGDPMVMAMGEGLARMRNTYGPVWTGMSTAAAALVGGRPVPVLLAHKVMISAFYLAAVALVGAMVRAFRRGATEHDATAAMFLFAWNPMALFEGVQNAHNDIVMLFFFLASLMLAGRGRHALAGILFAASVLVKYVTLFALPALLLLLPFERGKGKNRLPAAAFLLSAAITVVAAYAPFWIGPQTLYGIFEQTKLFQSDLLGPVAQRIVDFVVGSHGMVDEMQVELIRGTTYALFVMALLGIASYAVSSVDRAKAAIVASLSSLVAYIFAGSLWHMPWYLLWLLPFFILLDLPAAVAVVSIVELLFYGFVRGPILIAAAIAIWYAIRESLKERRAGTSDVLASADSA